MTLPHDEYVTLLHRGMQKGDVITQLLANQPKLVVMFALDHTLYSLAIPHAGETDPENFRPYSGNSEDMKKLCAELPEFVQMHESFNEFRKILRKGGPMPTPTKYM